MKLLSFLARRFAWKAYSQTLEDEAAAPAVNGEVADAVVVFVHAEEGDMDDDRRRSVFKKTLKHVKWLAGKRDLERVVLHSFTHLGGVNAEPEFAQGFLDELGERLRSTGYTVEQTPFGWFCEWQLDVYGESLAKVWKEFT